MQKISNKVVVVYFGSWPNDWLEGLRELTKPLSHGKLAPDRDWTWTSLTRSRGANFSTTRLGIINVLVCATSLFMRPGAAKMCAWGRVVELYTFRAPGRDARQRGHTMLQRRSVSSVLAGQTVDRTSGNNPSEAAWSSSLSIALTVFKRSDVNNFVQINNKKCGLLPHDPHTTTPYLKTVRFIGFKHRASHAFDWTNELIELHLNAMQQSSHLNHLTMGTIKLLAHLYLLHNKMCVGGKIIGDALSDVKTI